MSPQDPADRIAAARARLRGVRPDNSGEADEDRPRGRPMTGGAITPDDLGALRAEIARRRGTRAADPTADPSDPDR